MENATRRGADVPTSFFDAAPRCDASPSFYPRQKFSRRRRGAAFFTKAKPFRRQKKALWEGRRLSPSRNPSERACCSVSDFLTFRAHLQTCPNPAASQATPIPPQIKPPSLKIPSSPVSIDTTPPRALASLATASAASPVRHPAC